MDHKAGTTHSTAVTDLVEKLSNQQIEAYRANPTLVDEHANLERAMRQGSYGKRQLYELVQNGADAMLDTEDGRIHVCLTRDYLYCANTGNEIDADGVKALLHSHLSVKRRDEIGRFGLGFKSVLGVTQCPEFHSTAGSFGFDAGLSAKRISEAVPGAESCPTLRLASPIDSSEACASDSRLRELLDWATTVIRLPRDPDTTGWLHSDLEKFPAEFLLFCPHVASVILEDLETGQRRELAIERNDHGELVLRDGGDATVWRVFETTHKPSAKAKAEAGELAYRTQLPVIWAVPCSGRPGIGRMWAFFPLNDETTLSGILNAPWKTNDDRTNLLPGAFNEELLAVAARLVAQSLPKVVQDDDPGRVLDVMPARGREARGWGDDFLTPAVYEEAVDHPTIPDQDGAFQRPSDLKLHPESLPLEVLKLWSSQPERPSDWTHASVESRERRSRINRLFDLAEREAASLEDWLKALESDETSVESLKPGIRVAARLAAIADGSDDIRILDFGRTLPRCLILADAQGQMVKADPSVVFLPGEHPVVCPQIRLVHQKLSSDVEIRDCLGVLGIVPVTPKLELEALVSQGFSAWKENHWMQFWEVARAVERHDGADILRGKQVCVRTVSGNFKEIRFALLPGTVVPSDGTRDAEIAVDRAFHEAELGLLADIGVVEAPRAGYERRYEAMRRYTHEMQERYVGARPEGASKPMVDYLSFDRKEYVGPLEPYAHLSDEGRVAFTNAIDSQADLAVTWNIGHETRDDVYPSMECESPELWAIRRHGLLRTLHGLLPPEDCVGPTLSDWAAFFPVAECPDSAATPLGLPEDLSSLGAERWLEAYERATGTVDDSLLGKFYGHACMAEAPVPEVMHCRVGDGHEARAVHEATVTPVPDEFRALAKEGVPVLLASDDGMARSLSERWGLRPAIESVQSELLHVAASEAVLLVDRFPALRYRSSEGDIASIELLECSELRKETITTSGKYSCPEKFVIRDATVYWHTELGVASLLERLDARLNLDLGPDGREELLTLHADQERQKRCARIRGKETDGERLLEALGIEGIRPRLPAGLIQAVENEHGAIDAAQIAELALTVYGPDTLIEYKAELARAELEPPQRWAGSREARRFVRNLGFSRSYAGYEQARREPLLKVDGPMKLPPLHDYQLNIVQEIHGLALNDSKDRRGLVSLPTGAGKTRVAVEAIVALVRDHNWLGPILWVAQSDELCEQAVQTWREVWRAVGSEHELHISRLWANNDVEPIEEGVQIVVATIQKLENCFESSDYDWLQASLLVIDEAHGATTPSYTRLLSWQSIDRKQTRCPLIGLTATPFRGRSEDQTERLAARFGRNRLDRGLGDDPYSRLQELGVLSKVEHSVLPGVDVTLRPEELDKLKELGKIPSAVNDRIASNADRNRTLLEDVLRQPDDWSILLFAASVEHAQTMAALIRMAGSTAAPISADTAAGARRDTIEAFREGRIRVLTNYNVLTQGFDAPAIRAIYVARPTFSPNAYQQMIGRGLRGPRNGGKDVCSIVNVADNFLQYGERLAFQEFEHLWAGGA